jgi:2-dehydro-3-deoxyphosphogluconate aldolase/(4S)-4-hydroxy-2-oxoglutarate aldolase
MKSIDVFANLARHVVIPVIAIDSADSAIPLADALIEGGLPVAEITFRTAAAAEVIAKIAKERPSVIWMRGRASAWRPA